MSALAHPPPICSSHTDPPPIHFYIFIHSFTHSFSKHFLTACFVPGTILSGTGTKSWLTCSFSSIVLSCILFTSMPWLEWALRKSNLLNALNDLNDVWWGLQRPYYPVAFPHTPTFSQLQGLTPFPSFSGPNTLTHLLTSLFPLWLPSFPLNPQASSGLGNSALSAYSPHKVSTLSSSPWYFPSFLQTWLDPASGEPSLNPPVSWPGC